MQTCFTLCLWLFSVPAPVSHYLKFSHYSVDPEAAVSIHLHECMDMDVYVSGFDSIVSSVTGSSVSYTVTVKDCTVI